ncbi:FecR domain-containing protein [Stieleria sp. JC731]|uniref:LamG-like jellyroll fold domain-containing protein n=1 Tax=Pirellulaceae TaxID=2691357 RepID=UPI001E56E7E2|nr:LamG-like jellyroll fold domain-containing protein [Stieleria sp. JC731]MCC9601890.1 FecR domain-containing protein [Stieleria sp. JC731]
MDEATEELERLLIEWDAGTLDESGIQRVREILRSSEVAREHYIRSRMMNAAFELDSQAHLDSAIDPSIGVAQSSSDRVVKQSYAGHWRLLAVAASLVFVMLGARLIYLEFEMGTATESSKSGERLYTANQQAGEAMASGIAIVKSLVDVQWPSDDDVREVGDALQAGRFSMVSGIAQIEFFCGASVVVEGPAELDLENPMLAKLHRGRLRAQVPPAARGFSVDVAEMKVVDLGTEFGISVNDGQADVQVFDGEVELHRSAEPVRRLITGEGIKKLAEGAVIESEASPDLFVDIESLESREQDQENSRFKRWDASTARLRQDARLITYYRFDRQGVKQRRLKSGTSPADDELDGAIVGANRTSGRWSEKYALEFKKPGDRVRVQIPGEFKSLTLAAWVKIDSLDRWYNSLFLTDHYNQGEPHWQILDSGQLFFSVRHKPDDATGKLAKRQTHQPILSPPFWTPSLSGRWLFLATTYDADTGETTHYLNGEIIHQETIDPSLVVHQTRIGAATIGNWSTPTREDAEFAIRNLNGSMDEFAIFSAVLSPREIEEIYRNGKP